MAGCVEIQQAKGSLSFCASDSITPVTTSTPLVRSLAKPVPRVLGIGIFHRRDHARDSCCQNRLGARAGAPGVIAGLQRDVERGAACAISGIV